MKPHQSTVLYTRIITVIVVIILVLYSIDCNLFSGQSLQMFFAFSLGAISILAVAVVNGVISPDKLLIGRTHLWAFIWIVYLILHSALSPPIEYYYLYYYLLSLLLFIALSSLYRKEILSFETIYLLFVCASLFQVVVVWLQYFGLLSSGNNYFSVQGSLHNPNLTAMWIVLSIPYFCVRLSLKKQKLLLCGFLLSLIALIMLKCRTAYLGAVVIGCSIYFPRLKHVWSTRLSNPIKGIVLVTGCLLILSSSYYLYQFKKDSADGRFFVWKTAIVMMIQNPLGSGYGHFERSYNRFQSSYISEHQLSEQEQKNAGHVRMAYNEILEQGVQGGFLGILFYGLFLGSTILSIFRNGSIEKQAVVLSFCVMSLVNFSIQAVPIWWFFLFCVASVNSSSILSASRSFDRMGWIVLGLVTLFIGYQLIGFSNAQSAANQACQEMKKGNLTNAGILFSKWEKKAGSSEHFFSAYGRLFMKEQKWEQAIDKLSIASRFGSSPILLESLAECHFRCGEYEAAEEYLQAIRWMVPKNFRVRYKLLKLYQRLGDDLCATVIAREILKTKPKRVMQDVRFYRKEAQDYLRTLNDNNP